MSYLGVFRQDPVPDQHPHRVRKTVKLLTNETPDFIKARRAAYHPCLLSAVYVYIVPQRPPIQFRILLLRQYSLFHL